MIIISWDVGVIHLAYCIMEDKYDEKTGKHDISILDWDEINLLEDERLNLQCCGLKKAKKGDIEEECGKKASHSLHLASGKIIGFCRTHLSQNTNHWSEKKLKQKFQEHTGNTCEYTMRSEKLCGKKANYVFSMGNNKTHFCTAHYKMELKKKLKEYSPQPIKNTIVKKYPTSTLQLNLVTRLDELMEHFVKLGIRGVIIENQPAQKNPKMKSIANTLFDFFMIRGQVDHVYGVSLEYVKMVCPSNKLRVNENNTLEVFKANKNERKKYKLTKELGMQYTKQLLKSDPFYLDYLDMYKKKDDLCDAYLQGRYYLEYREDKCYLLTKKIDPTICSAKKMVIKNKNTKKKSKAKCANIISI